MKYPVQYNDELPINAKHPEAFENYSIAELEKIKTWFEAYSLASRPQVTEYRIKST